MCGECRNHGFGGGVVLRPIRANALLLTSSAKVLFCNVGSISTAYGALRRRRDPQCHQQDSFGTTPEYTPKPTAPVSSNGPSADCGILYRGSGI
jgi:hypothetical protein